jgi:hypothetical protein
MSWASRRVTTREEDIVYCLMGIFDINMPMLYGEGDKAFIRLQEEIIRHSQDESIFAWWDDPTQSTPVGTKGFLASGPHLFNRSGNVRNNYSFFDARRTISVVGGVIDIYLPLLDPKRCTTAGASKSEPRKLLDVRGRKTCFALLNCVMGDDSQQVAFLCSSYKGFKGFPHGRIETDKIHYRKRDDSSLTEMKPISLKKATRAPWALVSDTIATNFWIRVEVSRGRPKVKSIQPHPLLIGSNKTIRQATLEPSGDAQAFGFRFDCANGSSFDVTLEMVNNADRASILISTIASTSVGKSLEEAVNDLARTFASTQCDPFHDPLIESDPTSDRVVKELSSLGVVTVKVKKIGKPWEMATRKICARKYNVIKLFPFRDGGFQESWATDAEGCVPADVRYLIDVKLE